MSAKAALLIAVLTPALASPAWSQEHQDPKKDIESHARLAQQYLAQQRPELAIPELQKVIELDPGNTDAKGNLGVLLFFRGDYKGAVPQLRAVIKQKADLWKIQALLGLAETRQQEAKAGEADLQAAFPHLVQDNFQLDVGRTLISRYTASGDLDKAATVVSTLLASRPTDAPLLYLSYRLYSDLARQSLLTLSVAQPNAAELLQAMAHELVREGKNDTAADDLRQALKTDPHLPQGEFELAEILHVSAVPAQRAEAAQHYELALQQDPNSPATLTRLGDVAADKGDHGAAIGRYRQALALQPEDADASIGLAHELTETGKPEEALPLLLAVEKADPTNELAHYRLSAVYRRLHRPEDAKQEVAEYQHLKTIKEKLQGIYQTMRTNAPQANDVKE